MNKGFEARIAGRGEMSNGNWKLALEIDRDDAHSSGILRYPKNQRYGVVMVPIDDDESIEAQPKHLSDLTPGAQAHILSKDADFREFVGKHLGLGADSRDSEGVLRALRHYLGIASFSDMSLEQEEKWSNVVERYRINRT